MNIILFTREETASPLPLTDYRARHILSVLRLGEGDSFDAGIIDGPSGRGTIERVTAGELVCRFSFDSPPSEPYPLTLLIGFPRPIYTRRILRDLTTLGVGTIHFVATELGEKSYRDSRIWKNGEYLRYLREGAEQAHATRIPGVEFHRSLKSSFPALPSAADLLALDNNENGIRLSEYRLRENAAVLAIGSERGWSERERGLLREAGFTLAGLGDRVLRTETACIASTSLLLAFFGYM